LNVFSNPRVQNLGLALLFCLFSPAAALASWVDLQETPVEPTTTTTLQAPLPQAPNHPTFTEDWHLGVYGRGVSDALEESRVTGVNALGGLKYQPTNWLGTDITAGAVLETGSDHSLYDTNQPRNQMYLDQAEVQVTPFDWFSVSGGAINQRFLNMPLLVDSVAFPGVVEKMSAGNNTFNVALIGQQAIPTSTSMSTMTSDQEPLPQFMTQTLQMSVAPTREFKVSVRATHYSFSNLPSQVAFASYSNGNGDVLGDVPQNSYFPYEFAGYTGGGQVDLHLFKSFVVSAGGDYLVNTSAPSNNEGELLFTQVQFNMSSNWTLAPRGEFFFNDIDTSPAYYNSVAYGHNDRQGYAAELRAENKSAGVALKARYVDALLLQEDPNLANTQMFLLMLELFHAGT
jgi:hypothetical protein